MAWAFKFPATDRVALGPLSFKLGDDNVLIPQPSDDEIKRYKLEGYLKKLETPAPPVVEVVVPIVETDFSVVVPPSGDKLPPPVAEDDDDVFGEPVIPAEVNLEALGLPELRELAKAKAFPAYKTASKDNLIRAIKGA